MTSTIDWFKSSRTRFFRSVARPLTLLLLCCALIPSAQAADRAFLTQAQQQDFMALLPPPPVGVEQDADMASVISVHGAASSNEVAKAKAEGNFSEFVFTPAMGAYFKAGSLPKTEAFFHRLRLDSEQVVNQLKEHWQRLRPINANPSLNQGIKDKSFSYPSGHSTRATIYALVLAEIFPERAEAISATGREVGWHRVQLAMHYPSDIMAGRVLAQAITARLKVDEEFQKEIAEVKAELKAAESAANK